MSPVKYYLVGPLVFISRFRSARSLMTVRYGSSVFGPTTSLLRSTGTRRATPRWNEPERCFSYRFCPRSSRSCACLMPARPPPALLPFFASNIFFLFPSFHFALKCNRTNIFRYRKIECPLTDSNLFSPFSFLFFFLTPLSFNLSSFSSRSLFQNHLRLFSKLIDFLPSRVILESRYNNLNLILLQSNREK